eukprot:scaffold269471_cov36-Prasinocladus_malaysianus.AAC.7
MSLRPIYVAYYTSCSARDNAHRKAALLNKFLPSDINRKSHFPGSAMGRIFMQSSAFVAVILASSYTANLATFLTEAQQSGESSLASIHEAQLMASQICVINGTTAQAILTTNYNRIHQIPVTQLEHRAVSCLSAEALSDL